LFHGRVEGKTRGAPDAGEAAESKDRCQEIVEKGTNKGGRKQKTKKTITKKKKPTRPGENSIASHTLLVKFINMYKIQLILYYIL